MREIIAKAGERTRILHLFSDSIPQTVRFTAEPVAGGEASGAVEVTGSTWLFPKPPVRHPLTREQSFPKGFWDTNYSIHVTPDVDTRITFQSRHFTSKTLMIVLAVVVILAVASAVFVPFL
jgi:hypothetical protein